MITVADVMEMCMDFPIERHHLIQVKVQIVGKDGQVWTQEQHDEFDADFELLYDDSNGD